MNRKISRIQCLLNFYVSILSLEEEYILFLNKQNNDKKSRIKIRKD